MHSNNWKYCGTPPSQPNVLQIGGTPYRHQTFTPQDEPKVKMTWTKDWNFNQPLERDRQLLARNLPPQPNTNHVVVRSQIFMHNTPSIPTQQTQPQQPPLFYLNNMCRQVNVEDENENDNNMEPINKKKNTEAPPQFIANLEKEKERNSMNSSSINNKSFNIGKIIVPKQREKDVQELNSPQLAFLTRGTSKSQINSSVHLNVNQNNDNSPNKNRKKNCESTYSSSIFNKSNYRKQNSKRSQKSQKGDSSQNQQNQNEIPLFLQNKIKSKQQMWPLSVSPSEEKISAHQIFNIKSEVALSRENSPMKEAPKEFKKKKMGDYKQDHNPNTSQAFSVVPVKIFTIDDFNLKDKIGTGAFGHVYIAQQKQSGFICALKKISKKKIREQKNSQEHLLREIKLQSYLAHPHLTSLYGCFSDEEYVYLVLELLPDGSLKQNKRRMSQKDGSKMLKQIGQALLYLHKEDIIHRDLKPENIFLYGNYAKLGDFGCSVIGKGLRNTVIGSLPYLSPEQLNQNDYDDKIDVWGFGILTFQILLGYSPYERDIVKVCRQEITVEEIPDLQIPDEISPGAKDFISKLLNKDPSKRMTIKQSLSHPFVNQRIEEEEKLAREIWR